MVVLGVAPAACIGWPLTSWRDVLAAHHQSQLVKAPFALKTGLGDRIGYMLYMATIGLLTEKRVVFSWSQEVRGSEYPSDIENYINIPSSLLLVSQEEFESGFLDTPSLPIGSHLLGWYHGFDLVPETQYKMLRDAAIIRCDFSEYEAQYEQACSELFYKLPLPELPSATCCIHVRRGDKKKSKKRNLQADQNLQRIVDEIKNDYDHWLVLDEGDRPPLSVDPIQFSLNSDDKVRTVEEFFIMQNAARIVQSIPGVGGNAGWSSFSYIPARMGRVPLINCSSIDVNGKTRFHMMTAYCGTPLRYVFMHEKVLFDKSLLGRLVKRIGI